MISITLPIPTIISFVLGYILVYKVYKHNKNIGFNILKNRFLTSVILILFLSLTLMKHIVIVVFIIGMYLSFIINKKFN
ncbi:putative membrane protein [Clostridium bornimense]|uniref:Putative membrane protein n=1 Tax=Clostridium bornimense TaxID=1216932 RepID=W6S6Y1_9CLOT|nr:hypothetical protein [Clostridium bornimense]CDM70162.1 putative membrane protein [Clostridium bornimense]